MTIGIDIDDTITNTNKKIQEYLHKYIDNNQNDYRKLSLFKKSTFLTLYLGKIQETVELKKDVKKAIDYLVKCGCKIAIVTYRNNAYGHNIEKITKKYLDINHVYYDEIYFKSFEKGLICKQNKIDILIDDKESNLDNCKLYNIKCLKYDEANGKSNYQVMTSWQDILNYFKEGGFNE